MPLIIDDRIDIMLAVDAAGVHLGQSDLPAEAARQIIGPDKILGVSARTVEDAEKAESDGADYLGSVQFTRRQQRGTQRKCPGKSWKNLQHSQHPGGSHRRAERQKYSVAGRQRNQRSGRCFRHYGTGSSGRGGPAPEGYSVWNSVTDSLTEITKADKLNLIERRRL